MEVDSEVPVEFMCEVELNLPCPAMSKLHINELKTFLVAFKTQVFRWIIPQQYTTRTVDLDGS